MKESSDLPNKEESFVHNVPTEDLKTFARFLLPKIQEFYESEEGKAYFTEWQKCHKQKAA